MSLCLSAYLFYARDIFCKCQLSRASGALMNALMNACVHACVRACMYVVYVQKILFVASFSLLYGIVDITKKILKIQRKIDRQWPI